MKSPSGIRGVHNQLQATESAKGRMDTQCVPVNVVDTLKQVLRVKGGKR